MRNIIYVIFRRMRAPLISLIVTYAVTICGLTLIPGVDDQGNVWHMDFFHAFYFVSFMSTTIGFGEIPYAFSPAQRLWVTFSVYAGVVVWLYAIGTLIGLLQDPAFRLAVTEGRFARRTKRMSEDFYLVCGYGETGSALVEALTERDQRAVVIDIDPERINVLRLESLRQYVPGLCADASVPLHLVEAGLSHMLCAGVVALTNVNETNLHIAITSKLLHKEVKVICRADSREVEANMASFGTDYIVDPFDTFATHLATALQAPCLYLLQEWLTGLAHERLREPLYPPRNGPWVLCGYGRFGKAVYERLIEEGLEVVVVEADPERTAAPPDCVVGWGTEAVTLQEAKIADAVGLVAGTDHDVNNLSIIMTARELNPNLFVILRQNLKTNDPIVDAVQADMVMHPSSIIANKIRVLLATPLLSEFLRAALYQDDPWACQLLSRIIGLVDVEVPHIWEVAIGDRQAHAVTQALAAGSRVNLGHLLTDPHNRARRLKCIALMLRRQGSRSMLPEPGVELRAEDRLLFCGRYSAQPRMDWTLQNEHALAYVTTGGSMPKGLVWRLLEQAWRRDGRSKGAGTSRPG
jgi:Trk K+ transport system NAD-binding subunit